MRVGAAETELVRVQSSAQSKAVVFFMVMKGMLVLVSIVGRPATSLPILAAEARPGSLFHAKELCGVGGVGRKGTGHTRDIAPRPRHVGRALERAATDPLEADLSPFLG